MPAPSNGSPTLDPRAPLVPGRLAGMILLLATEVSWPAPARSQPYGEPDRGAPGDEMVQAWLAARAKDLDGRFLDGIATAADWEAARPHYREEYLYMLGLWPLPERTPLGATVTGTLQRPGYVVEKLHYQSRPGLYVTANLYRPATVTAGERLPAVLYVCGHSGMGRNGNKTAYQSHGIWFARHGYVCLVVDTLQLGEIAGIHHGTYRENRWWWLSRGYTPAGVECWNGIRGIDYLEGRPDVDPARIAVTGISGGGAATFWIAAADDRVQVAVPVSGMADLESYVGNRVINGHCDCMFLHNALAWPWTRIAGLVAPRPMLFVNSHRDPIFPMDANERISARLEMLYAMFGAGDRFDAVVSLGGHAYRKDIRAAAYRFIAAHLKGDPREVLDGEADLPVEADGKTTYPIPPEDLRVFPKDEDLPADRRNTTVDRWFVPQADVTAPEAGTLSATRSSLVRELRRVAFGALPERVPPAKLVAEAPAGEQFRAEFLLSVLTIETEPGVRLALQGSVPPGRTPSRAVLWVEQEGPSTGGPGPSVDPVGLDASTWRLQVRGVGGTRWTGKNPPNFVERSHVLVGTTVDAQRVRDIVAAARYLRERTGAEVWVAGRGAGAVLAACAALLEEEISGVTAIHPPASLMDGAGAPRLLDALRVCDVAELLGMVAPRPLRLAPAGPLEDGRGDVVERVRAWYAAAGAPAALEIEGADRR